MDFLPDASFIEEIRKRLWCGREVGQAAVMIGAGFSRNAVPLSPSAPPFPLWKELKDRMITALYPKYLAKGPTNTDALELAREFELTFSRNALDELILKAVPDQEYEPGKLHSLLLSLPWSDVYTTNYDTLIERARSSVFDRKYDLVCTSSDIPTTMKPRIVKLHGSFPSHRPFIMSDEDYRTYPREFAPMVNMVQQSIMENTLCLIGFSGDDPNFLHWIGWVRDNLRGATPPIYLVGLLNLSPSRRRLLESRRVYPIDLSPLFTKDLYPNAQIRHQYATEWFLRSLEKGAPADKRFWPKPQTRTPQHTYPHLPPLLPGPNPPLGPGPSNLQGEPLKSQDINSLISSWRQCRLNDPGWIVLPPSNSSELWMYTKDWIEPVFKAVPGLTGPNDLFLLDELVWRVERTGFPLAINWASTIESVLDKYNPFPRQMDSDSIGVIRPSTEGYRELDWQEISAAWVRLAFAITREARDDQDITRYKKWHSRLEPICQGNPEWISEWYYESALWHLSRTELLELRKTLSSWPLSRDQTGWSLKRAGILAELGDTNEAQSLVLQTLAEIRRRMPSVTPDFRLLSQEGWAMLLSKALQRNKLDTEEELKSEYSDRWERLTAYRCSPWPVISELTSDLEELGRKGEDTPDNFDPYRVAGRSIHFSSDSPFEKTRPAFAFMRMFEHTGLPMRCGSVNMWEHTTVTAAKAIEEFAPMWALSALIRTGSAKNVASWFDRVKVAQLAEETVTALYEMLTASLIQALGEVAHGSFSGLLNPKLAERHIRIACEVLSRICFRLDPEKQLFLFDMALQMYVLPRFRSDYLLHQPLEKLFERLMFSIDPSVLTARLGPLISLSIPGENGFEVSTAESWPEPTDYFVEPSNWEPSPDDDLNPRISNLIHLVRIGSVEIRRRAIQRLHILRDLGYLSADEQSTFGEAIWNQRDQVTGLPTGTPLWVAAEIPGPAPSMAYDSIKQYLFKAGFPHVFSHTEQDGRRVRSVSIGRAPGEYHRNWLSVANVFSSPPLPIEWTPREMAHLLSQIESWWAQERDEFSSERFGSLFDVREELMDRASLAVDLLSRVVIPRVDITDIDTQNVVLATLESMSAHSVPTAAAYPMTLHFAAEKQAMVTTLLRQGLNSLDHVLVREAIRGLSRWILLSVKGNTAQGIPVPPPDLLFDLVRRLTVRQQPGLESTMVHLAELLEECPETLSEPMLESISTALWYLAEETKLISPDHHANNLTIRPTIPLSDRPRARGLAARLANRMYLHLVKKGMPIPESVLGWKEAASRDPLPEVRREWREILAP